MNIKCSLDLYTWLDISRVVLNPLNAFFIFLHETSDYRTGFTFDSNLLGLNLNLGYVFKDNGCNNKYFVWLALCTMLLHDLILPLLFPKIQVNIFFSIFWTQEGSKQFVSRGQRGLKQFVSRGQRSKNALYMIMNKFTVGFLGSAW